MSQGFGPFSVDPAQVAGLGGALFQNLVSRLLEAEASSVGMSGGDLRTSYQENRGDQGVDAGLYAATATTWVPAGDSAWQFKAGDLSPQGCADELEGATRAREIIANGGKYRLVLGKGLEDYQIEAREKRLREKAAELGYDVSGDNFKVLDGNQLARWVEQYPQLAVSTLLRGVGNVAIAFDKWQQSSMHQSTWVRSDERDELRATVTEFLEDTTRVELRIEGVSGLGKTRGVLEALRGSSYEALVLYVGDADDLNYPLIDSLTEQGRSAVVVIDECTRKKHNVFAQQLQDGQPVKLITIGERDTRVTQSIPIVLAPLPGEVIEEVLKQNKPALWAEARRVVVANCAGNVRWAMYVAEAVLRDPNINVGSLIDEKALQLLVGDLLSGDDDFLALSALALFPRYGVDREREVELKQIGRGLDIAFDRLLAANSKLGRLGLLTRHGRYRSVTPQPLAVYLATRAWESLGDRILSHLLPSLDQHLAEQLLLRAADLGSSGPAANALGRILGPEGPFNSLGSIAEGTASKLLVQIAIVSPQQVAEHMVTLLSDASDYELRDLKSIRRDLVWTLEKLVWHSATFSSAADMLLRLALCENETWSNNSTGTWMGLFAPMLPATAARPRARMDYLSRAADDANVATRALVAQAASAAIDVRGGHVMVSGEMQGGVVVEPRGTPTTYDEYWDYLRSGIKLLRLLADDSDPEVRDVAVKGLLDAIHPMLEEEAVREDLFDALASLPDEGIRKVRTQVEQLYALFANVEKPEFRNATATEPDVAARRIGLDLLHARLPEAGLVDELAALASAQRWEWGDGELQAEVTRLAVSMPKEDAPAALWKLLTEAEPPAASYELGSALYAVAASEETAARLASLADGGNVAGLVGYLYAAMADGRSDAFDSLLDGSIGRDLDPATRLVLTVRGPQSDAGWARLLDLIGALPVHAAAPRMFGWHVGVSEARLTMILDAWLSKIETQADYNFAVDVIAMIVYQRPSLSTNVEDQLWSLVRGRSLFPEVGQQSWDWVQLARRRSSTDAEGVLSDLLHQVEVGSLHIMEGSEEQKLVEEVIAATGSSSLDSVLSQVQGGSWRLQMDFRGWLADRYPAADVVSWVGEDVDRARLVASLVRVGGTEPSELVRFLLDKFGDDDKVTSSLYGDFVSGTWWGNESERLATQIEQLQVWAADRAQPPGVRAWATRVIASLRQRRLAVLEQEAEERY